MDTTIEGLTLRDARQAHYEANDLGADGGISARWVKFKVRGVPVAFPNFAARRRAVRLHDLHHILTGYGTDLAGEGAISAY